MGRQLVAKLTRRCRDGLSQRLFVRPEPLDEIRAQYRLHVEDSPRFGDILDDFLGGLSQDLKRRILDGRDIEAKGVVQNIIPVSNLARRPSLANIGTGVCFLLELGHQLESLQDGNLKVKLLHHGRSTKDVMDGLPNILTECIEFSSREAPLEVFDLARGQVLVVC